MSQAGLEHLTFRPDRIHHSHEQTLLLYGRIAIIFYLEATTLRGTDPSVRPMCKKTHSRFSQNNQECHHPWAKACNCFTYNPPCLYSSVFIIQAPALYILFLTFVVNIFREKMSVFLQHHIMGTEIERFILSQICRFIATIGAKTFARMGTGRKNILSIHFLAFALPTRLSWVQILVLPSWWTTTPEAGDLNCSVSAHSDEMIKIPSPLKCLFVTIFSLLLQVAPIRDALVKETPPF